MTELQLNRRTVLRATGVGAVGVAGLTALTACGGSSTGAADTSSATHSSAGTAGSAGSAASGAAGSSAAGGSSAASGAATIVALADVPVGGSVAARIDGNAALVTQPKAGTVKAFSSVCTHMHCTVGAGPGPTLNCPCHGSKYDLTTGAPVAGPAPRPLTPIPVKVSGGNVVSG